MTQITERKHNGSGSACESALQDVRSISQAPGNEAAADAGVARALPLLVNPVAVAIAATEQTEAAAWLTAAASLPPETISIGASGTGCSIPSASASNDFEWPCSSGRRPRRQSKELFNLTCLRKWPQ